MNLEHSVDAQPLSRLSFGCKYNQSHEGKWEVIVIGAGQTVKFSSLLSRPPYDTGQTDLKLRNMMQV